MYLHISVCKQGSSCKLLKVSSIESTCNNEHSAKYLYDMERRDVESPLSDIKLVNNNNDANYFQFQIS